MNPSTRNADAQILHQVGAESQDDDNKLDKKLQQAVAEMSEEHLHQAGGENDSELRVIKKQNFF